MPCSKWCKIEFVTPDKNIIIPSVKKVNINSHCYTDATEMQQQQWTAAAAVSPFVQEKYIPYPKKGQNIWFIVIIA